MPNNSAEGETQAPASEQVGKAWFKDIKKVKRIGAFAGLLVGVGIFEFRNFTNSVENVEEEIDAGWYEDIYGWDVKLQFDLSRSGKSGILFEVDTDCSVLVPDVNSNDIVDGPNLVLQKWDQKTGPLFFQHYTHWYITDRESVGGETSWAEQPANYEIAQTLIDYCEAQ